jgi:uncharacterized heparinase superfamily protein
MASPLETTTELLAPLSPARWQGAFRRLYHGSALYNQKLRRNLPDRVHGSFPLRWAGNPDAGKEILDGTFVFAGRRVSLGNVPWGALTPNTPTAEWLHGFRWLGDLIAVGSDEAGERARDLVHTWIELNPRWSQFVWRPDILGRRLAAWLAASDVLMANVGEGRRRQFVQSAAVQARHLDRVAMDMTHTEGGIDAATGQIAAALCLEVGDLREDLDDLEWRIERQILPDGGQLQRSPSVHMRILNNLLSIRAALQPCEADLPLGVEQAIDRMAAMLRAYRLGDGTLALFNGSKEEDPAAVDAVLADAGTKGGTPRSAAHVGFERLAAGTTVMIVDVGAPARGEASRSAHAGTLSFEMSVGKDRLIVNCGAFFGDDAKWRQAARSTAAHSTVSVDETSSAEFTRDGRLRHHSVKVTAERRETDGAIWLETSHSAYRRTFRLTHHRSLYMSPLGEDIRGQDELEGSGGNTLELRFHLHPAVEASLAEDGASVGLKLPHEGRWRFLSVGGVMSLEESAYLGVSDVPIHSQQIVITFPLSGEGARVKWAIRREDPAAAESD